ncbi:MAG: hypothetical protein GX089_08950, partial [Fibrobacter sp.]|nr:hypothetical protein [Fibrobacter sp.]
MMTFGGLALGIGMLVSTGELENDLGYSKWDYREKGTTNSRNGYSEKTLKSSLGEIPIKVP